MKQLRLSWEVDECKPMHMGMMDPDDLVEADVDAMVWRCKP